MTVGLECYRDVAGAVPYFSTALAAGFILGSVDLSVGSNTGSLTDADLANGSPFFFLYGSGGGAQQQPSVSFSGTTMSWSPSVDGAGWSGTIFYGIR